MKNAIVFYGERGEMRITGEIPNGFTLTQQSLQDRPVIIGRLNNADARLIKPALDSINCFDNRQRPLMDTEIDRKSVV